MVKRPNLVGKLVAVTWADAFDDSEVHPDDLTEEYVWDTYGKVIRQTDLLLTVASNEGGKGKDHQVSATSILWSMVVEVNELMYVGDA